MDSWDAAEAKILFMSSTLELSKVKVLLPRNAMTTTMTIIVNCREPKSSGETNWIAPRYNILYSICVCVLYKTIWKGELN